MVYFIILDACRKRKYSFSTFLLNILQTGLGVLLTTLQVGVRRAHRSSDSVESKALRLGRELHIRQYCVSWKRGGWTSTDLDLGANVEESKVTRN